MSRTDKEMGGMDLPATQRFGAIDLGSHTIRLLVADLRDGGTLAPVHRDRKITRLAGGFQPHEILQEGPMKVSLQALQEYVRELKDLGVSSAACGATGVLRRAGNRDEFMDRVKDWAGLAPRILTEQEEALLSSKGVLSVLPDPEGFFVIFDLGGGSTELTLLHAGRREPLWCTSVFLGAATITERFLRGDPPGRPALESAALCIRDTFGPTLRHLKRLVPARQDSAPAVTLVGTAGTVTTLAAMKLKMTDYRPHRVNGLLLDREWLLRTVQDLAASTLEERGRTAGLERGREDIILGGAMVVQALLEGLGLERMAVTDAGLLEGLLLDHVETALGRPKTLLSPLTWQTEKG